MTILFVSLISKDDYPLYIQSFEKAPEPGTSAEDAGEFLKYNFLSHMALDVFTSPSAMSLREQQSGQNGILLLFIQDGVTVYGTETNNGLRIVVGSSDDVRSERLVSLFQSVHKCYLKQVCNPFTQLSGSGEDVLQSRAFDEGIRKVVESFS